MQALKGRIVREMKEVREMHPNATEWELVRKLMEMGAHPQTISLQRSRAQRFQGQEVAAPAARICKPVEQPKRIWGKKNPLAVPIPSRSQQQLQVSMASTRTKSAIPRPLSRMPVPTAPAARPQSACPRPASKIPQPLRPVPRTSTAVKQEINQRLRQEAVCPRKVQPVCAPARKPPCARSQEPVCKRAQNPVCGPPRKPTCPYAASKPAGESVESFELPGPSNWESGSCPRNADGNRTYSISAPEASSDLSGINFLKDTGNLSPEFMAEWSFSEVQDMIDDEKKEIRSMQAVVSQLMDPARQVQFKDMYSLVPHVFSDETETSPEVAAAILHSDEKGVSLKTTPAKLYDTLFQGGEADRTVMKVNAPSAHSKAGVLVPLSSEGVEASFLGYEPAGLYEVIPQSADSKMPTPKKEETGIGSVRDNLGFSASSLSRGSQVSVSTEDGQFKIILQPDVPKENDFIQIRGSQPPSWFPGYYSMMGDSKSINVTEKPWNILEWAWREFIPEKINTDTGKIIVGS